jgi:hypothetical protein
MDHQIADPIIIVPANVQMQDNAMTRKKKFFKQLIKKEIIKVPAPIKQSTQCELFTNGYYFPSEGENEVIVDNVNDRNNNDINIVYDNNRNVNNRNVNNRNINNHNDNIPPHSIWLAKLGGINETIDHNIIFWGIIEDLSAGRKKVYTPIELKNFAVGVEEMYNTMNERFEFIQFAISKIILIYNIIARGYYAYEAVLESPELATFFVETERITMPKFSNLFENI